MSIFFFMLIIYFLEIRILTRQFKVLHIHLTFLLLLILLLLLLLLLFV